MQTTPARRRSEARILVPPIHRRRALALAVMSGGLLVALSAAVRVGGINSGWGGAVTDAVHALPGPPWTGTMEVLWAITAAGAVAVIAAAILCWRWSSRRGALLVLGAPILSLLVSDAVLKPLTGRRLIEDGAYSFPSGHVATATAAGLALLVLLMSGLPHGRIAAGCAALVLAAGAAAAPLVVGAAVLALRWHDAVDVLGGVLLGVPVVLGGALALDAAAARTAR